MLAPFEPALSTLQYLNQSGGLILDKENLTIHCPGIEVLSTFYRLSGETHVSVANVVLIIGRHCLHNRILSLMYRIKENGGGSKLNFDLKIFPYFGMSEWFDQKK